MTRWPTDRQSDTDVGELPSSPRAMKLCRAWIVRDPMLAMTFQLSVDSEGILST